MSQMVTDHKRHRLNILGVISINFKVYILIILLRNVWIRDKNPNFGFWSLEEWRPMP